jgi:hypothetical protein
MWRVNSHLQAAFPGWAAPRGFTKMFLCILIVIGGALITSDVFSQGLRLGLIWLEKDKTAPVDYGFGPDAGVGPARPNLVLGQTPAIPNPSGWSRKQVLRTLAVVVAVAEVAQAA